MDFIGQIYPASSKGRTFIIVAIDYFTKWVEASAVKTITSTIVKKFIKTKILHKYGVPETIVTDRGPSFISREVDEFADKFKIKMIQSSPYYPQSNGQAEASNKILSLLERVICSAFSADNCSFNFWISEATIIIMSSMADSSSTSCCRKVEVQLTQSLEAERGGKVHLHPIFEDSAPVLKTLGFRRAPRRPQFGPDLLELTDKFGQRNNGRIDARGGGGITLAPLEASAEEAASIGSEVVRPEEEKTGAAAVLVFFFGQRIRILVTPEALGGWERTALHLGG
ncbi:uncharacterized protein LOC126601769 [Malus sylvestris]|uniref:uncharacterized protein LOC126601769 n=1 Tax=Malus sylvestris TaxID=3752 RepID=UPI0021ACAF07|nr:uncharacterized protein LOC126601769 [Malus sylvestris]